MQAEQPIVWQLPPRQPVLDEGHIHVWKLALVHADLPAEEFLTGHERARHNDMVDPRGRARFATLRFAMRQVLGAYLDTEPGRVELTLAAGGKPGIPGGPEFNLSHGGDLALLAVSSRPVGIDVEPVRRVPRCAAIARRVLGDEIAQALECMPAAERDLAFLWLWTAMEARQKCHGEGVFGRRIDAVEVGSLAFLPDAHHLAQLAWRDPVDRPDFAFYAQSAS